MHFSRRRCKGQVGHDGDDSVAGRAHAWHHVCIANRGGPTMIHGYSVEYPRFWTKNFIHILSILYMYMEIAKKMCNTASNANSARPSASWTVSLPLDSPPGHPTAHVAQPPAANPLRRVGRRCPFAPTPDLALGRCSSSIFPQIQTAQIETLDPSEIPVAVEGAGARRA